MLCAALEGNQSLTQLELGATKMGNRGFRSVGTMLARNRFVDCVYAGGLSGTYCVCFFRPPYRIVSTLFLCVIFCTTTVVLERKCRVFFFQRSVPFRCHCANFGIVCHLCHKAIRPLLLMNGLDSQ